jgi:hypothetical protein
MNWADEMMMEAFDPYIRSSKLDIACTGRDNAANSVL